MVVRRKELQPAGAPPQTASSIVGGMQKPLVENDLITKLDVSRLRKRQRNDFIRECLSKEAPGFQFIGYEGDMYGVPTMLQGDSFAYLPNETGELGVYGALLGLDSAAACCLYCCEGCETVAGPSPMC